MPFCVGKNSALSIRTPFSSPKAPYRWRFFTHFEPVYHNMWGLGQPTIFAAFFIAAGRIGGPFRQTGRGNTARGRVSLPGTRTARGAASRLPPQNSRGRRSPVLHRALVHHTMSPFQMQAGIGWISRSAALAKRRANGYDKSRQAGEAIGGRLQAGAAGRPAAMPASPAPAVRIRAVIPPLFFFLPQKPRGAAIADRPPITAGIRVTVPGLGAV